MAAVNNHKTEYGVATRNKFAFLDEDASDPEEALSKPKEVKKPDVKAPVSNKKAVTIEAPAKPVAIQKEDGGNQRGPNEDGSNRRGPYRDAGNRRGLHEDGGRRGPNKNGGYRRGPNEDGGYRRGPNEDGGFRRGPNDDGGNRRGPNEDGGYRRGPNEDGGYRRGPNDDGGNRRGPYRDVGNRRGPNDDVAIVVFLLKMMVIGAVLTVMLAIDVALLKMVVFGEVLIVTVVIDLILMKMGVIGVVLSVTVDVILIIVENKKKVQLTTLQMKKMDSIKKLNPSKRMIATSCRRKMLILMDGRIRPKMKLMLMKKRLTKRPLKSSLHLKSK